MFWNRKRNALITEALSDLDEDLLLKRYGHFLAMYGLFFNSFIRIFTLHGIMSSVFLGIIAAINADRVQEPFFYVASTSFYGIISFIIILTIGRLRNLISVYSEEIRLIERRIRVSNIKQRFGFKTSDLISWLILAISFIISCYLIAPARESYVILRPFSPFLELFDVPIDLSGLHI